MPKISCVICAYNEEKAIDATLQAVADHPDLSEVIVVDDGSKDRTREIVGKYKNIKLISHETNRGKSAALATGFRAASGDHIMMLDADLKGLTKKDVSDLLHPVITNQADKSISLRKNSLGIYHLLGLDFVSGERVFPAHLVKDIIHDVENLSRWGFEVFLNRHAINKKLRLAVVPWREVSHMRAHEKQGWWGGVKKETKMVFDILRAVGALEILAQHRELLRLRVSHPSRHTSSHEVRGNEA